MKLECSIIEVRDAGDVLHIVLQGKGIGDADWREWERQELRVADSPANRRAYHIGRKIIIDVKPARQP